MRRIQTMMTDWSFIGPEGKKETVCLPHTWNALDGQDGGNDYYRGECLYEKHFEKPPFGSEEVVPTRGERSSGTYSGAQARQMSFRQCTFLRSDTHR